MRTSFDYSVRLLAQARVKWLNRKDPCDAQRRLLTYLLDRASGTRFGRFYQFDQLSRSDRHCYEQYRARVPIQGYESFDRDWFTRYAESGSLDNVTWPGRVKWYCETSGTTSGSKRIPLTDDMFRMNRRAVLDMLSFYAMHPQKARVLRGKVLYMAGSTALTSLDEGIYAGDMSAITLVNRPVWLAGKVLPAEPLSSAPWERRLQGMASLLINDSHLSILSGVPPWIVLLLQEVERQSGVPCHQALPHLKLIIHGGTAIGPYLPEFRSLLSGMTVDFLELLPSSEAFMGYQHFGDQQMSLAPWYGTFFEFAPVTQIQADGKLAEDAYTVPLWNVVPGEHYALVLSTCSGLWRYHIGDTVKFMDNETLHFEFTGRTRSLETFEEKVTQYEVEQAIARLKSDYAVPIVEYIVGPNVSERCHCWVLAATGPVPDDSSTSACLDAELQIQNDDYRTFRQQGRIAAPQVYFVDQDMIYRWSQTARGRLGGQSKIPRIDPTGGDLITSLLASIREYKVGS